MAITVNMANTLIRMMTLDRFTFALSLASQESVCFNGGRVGESGGAGVRLKV